MTGTPPGVGPLCAGSDGEHRRRRRRPARQPRGLTRHADHPRGGPTDATTRRRRSGLTTAETVRRWLAQCVAGAEAPLPAATQPSTLCGTRDSRRSPRRRGTRGELLAQRCADSGQRSHLGGRSAQGDRLRHVRAARLRDGRATRAGTRASTASRSRVRLSPPRPTATRVCAAPVTSTCWSRRCDLARVRLALAAAGLQGAAHYPEWYEERLASTTLRSSGAPSR